MENQLLNIKINQDDIEKAISNAAKARTELDKLKASNKELEKQKKELMKADGDQSAAIESLNKQIAKNSTQIKASSAVVRENEKIVTTNTQAQKANEGSITQLRKQLAIVSKQWAELSEEERENEEIGGKLAKQKLDLTEKLKAEEKATGDTRRNVGNYSESVQEAIESSGLFGRQLGQLKQAQQAYRAASAAATKGTKAFRLALISTGIGAIVVAVGALVAAFASTQEGIDKVTSVTRPLAAVFQRLKGLAQDLATNVFGGLSKILRGDIREGLADLKNGFTDAVGGIGDAIKEGVEAGTELDKLQKQIEQTEIDLTKRRAELNVQYERSREISEDESKSEEERRKAAIAALEAQDELLKRNQEFLDLQIEKKKIELSLNDSDREAKKELAELEAQRTQFEAEAAAKRTSARNFLESLDKEIQANELARIKEIEDAEQEATDKAIALKQKEEEEKARIEQEFAELVTQREDQRREEEKVKLAEQRAEGLITREEYEQQLLQIELNTLEAAKIAAEEAKQAAINNTELTELERQRIILESEAIILQARKRTADLSIQAEQKLAKATETLEDEKVEQSKVSSADIISGTQNVAKEGSLASKAAGVAQSTISTYTAAAKALEAGGILGPILAALVTAKGLLNVKKIVSIPTPSFADGGFTGSGYGSPDSSGYKPAGIVHEGEYVIKKSMVDNPAFSGIINTLENSRLKGYADGGMVGRTASIPAQEGAQASQLQNTISMLSQIRPIVKVTDINRVSGQAQMVKVSGELS